MAGDRNSGLLVYLAPNNRGQLHLDRSFDGLLCHVGGLTSHRSKHANDSQEPWADLGGATVFGAQ